MTEHRQSKKRRILRLSDEPELGLGRYHASYRDPTGKPRRKRFSKDRTESELAYRRWVVENYNQAAVIVAPSGDLGKWNINQSLPATANAYTQHEKRPVRPKGARRATGTISRSSMTAEGRWSAFSSVASNDTRLGWANAS